MVVRVVVLPDDGLGPLTAEPEGEEVDGGREGRAAGDGGAVGGVVLEFRGDGLG